MKCGLTILAMLAAAAILSACATVPQIAEGEALSADASEAEQLAHYLARASDADDAGDPQLLAQMLERIDQLGARPATEAEEAILAGWQQRAAPGTPPMRGRLHGPGFQTGWIAAGSAIEVEQTFLSGQRAAIAVEATRGSTLGLAVADGSDETICNRASRRRSACEWVPVFTRRHIIRIANPGTARAYYHLAME